LPRIVYEPDGRKVEAGEGETILSASLKAGIPHAHACGGNARCSTCRVLVTGGLQFCAPRNDAEGRLARRLSFSPDIRLACQTTITGDVSLRRLVLDAEDEELTSQLDDRTPASVGTEKVLAILFADIRGFTAFSEALPPYDVIYVLNRYFHQMGEVINRHGGFINNTMGDALMALFGMDDPADAPLRAVRAGLGMLEAVEQLRAYLEAVYAMSFRIGVGIHSGEVVVGTVGGAGLRSVTAIGDAVNVASRIEAANKDAGTSLLVSEAVYEQVKGDVVPGRTCVRVALRGRSGEHTLYEIVGIK
jgi:adenylate cyclase